MKGAGTLASLVAAAALAGLLLALLKPRPAEEQGEGASPAGIEQYVEETVGLRLKRVLPPTSVRVGSPGAPVHWNSWDSVSSPIAP